MELAPPQVAAFKLFKSWGIMKIFNAIGFPKLAVKSNFKLYTNGSALVALLVKDHEPQTYLELGRLLQRFWLTATSLGLNIHPLTGVPFMMQRINDNKPEPLKQYQAEIIKHSYKIISEVWPPEITPLAFFAGWEQQMLQAACSSRLDPEIQIKN